MAINHFPCHIPNNESHLMHHTMYHMMLHFMYHVTPFNESNSISAEFDFNRPEIISRLFWAWPTFYSIHFIYIFHVHVCSEFVTFLFLAARRGHGRFFGRFSAGRRWDAAAIPLPGGRIHSAAAAVVAVVTVAVAPVTGSNLSLGKKEWTPEGFLWRRASFKRATRLINHSREQD